MSGGDLGVFVATESTDGRELWVTNGSGFGTNLALNTGPGDKSGDPQWLVQAGSSLYFTADDGATGYELHRIDVDTLGGYVAERIAGGGPGSTGLVPGLRVIGVPRISNSQGFGVELFDATPASIAALMLSNVAVRTQIGPGCAALVPLSTPPALAVIAGSQGYASVNIPLPPNPALIGSEVDMQFWVVDPGACALGIVAPSDGLRIVFGT